MSLQPFSVIRTSTVAPVLKVTEGLERELGSASDLVSLAATAQSIIDFSGSHALRGSVLMEESESSLVTVPSGLTTST